MVESPLILGILYLLTFSATKQVGGILFAMVFLTASTIVSRQKLRLSLITSAIGMAILFGSVEIDSLLHAVYPPFGLVTISFMPLGSYLLFAGIFVSARFISQDVEIRREFHKRAESQSALLKSIGMTQMEKELEKTFKSVLERSNVLEENDCYPEGEDTDMKEMVREVPK